ncbi:hypothetical protein HPB47_012443 [Ixodes persulcatus]|uniref:Uncharacterized protein n=1 Tax=Ixodes persulcatus TaxID=34615 RepID=A0AC60NTK2_IXOPE|nr:hypothetical protein HPB47_012443 [Ixodes persulcatus]
MIASRVLVNPPRLLIATFAETGLPVGICVFFRRPLFSSLARKLGLCRPRCFGDSSERMQRCGTSATVGLVTLSLATIIDDIDDSKRRFGKGEDACCNLDHVVECSVAPEPTAGSVRIVACTSSFGETAEGKAARAALLSAIHHRFEREDVNETTTSSDDGEIVADELAVVAVVSDDLARLCRVEEGKFPASEARSAQLGAGWDRLQRGGDFTDGECFQEIRASAIVRCRPSFAVASRPGGFSGARKTRIHTKAGQPNSSAAVCELAGGRLHSRRGSDVQVGLLVQGDVLEVVPGFPPDDRHRIVTLSPVGILAASRQLWCMWQTPVRLQGRSPVWQFTEASVARAIKRGFLSGERTKRVPAWLVELNEPLGTGLGEERAPAKPRGESTTSVARHPLSPNTRGIGSGAPIDSVAGFSGSGCGDKHSDGEEGSLSLSSLVHIHAVPAS